MSISPRYFCFQRHRQLVLLIEYYYGERHHRAQNAIDDTRYSPSYFAAQRLHPQQMGRVRPRLYFNLFKKQPCTARASYRVDTSAH